MMTNNSNVKGLDKLFGNNNLHFHNHKAANGFFSNLAKDPLTFSLSSKCNSLSDRFYWYLIIGKPQHILLQQQKVSLA